MFHVSFTQPILQATVQPALIRPTFTRAASPAWNEAFAMEFAAAFRSGASRAKRVAALNAEIAKCGRLIGELAAANMKVDAMTVPPVTWRTMDGEVDRREYRCGDGWVYRFAGSFDRGIIDAVASWRENRLGELGIGYKHTGAKRDLATAREKLAKASREPSAKKVATA